jgi:hypothetical protein
MKSNSKKISKIVLALITLGNIALLSAGITATNWVLTVFCALIFQLIAVSLYQIIVNHKQDKARIKQLQLQVNDVYYRVDALMSIHHVLKFRHPLPIMQSWMITADYAHALLQLILAKKDGDVLDVGSGISTLIAGYAVEKRGNGKVISIEHEEQYFKHTQALVKLHNLENFVEVHYCPIVKHEIKGQSWRWYDISKVKSFSNVQVISVDGPPGKLQKLSRYPVLPLLHASLPKNIAVLLDDGARDDEQQTAERWKQEFGLTVEYTNSIKGLFILR